jgi:NADPH-dependent glutamate synthase beta subunit-like oxidoreductase
MTREFTGYETRVGQLHGCEVEWIRKSGNWKIKEVPGTDFVYDVEIVILAMGFVHVVRQGLIKDMSLKLDDQGNVAVNNYQTSDPQVFAAGDTVIGASLVVHAIDSGRQAAAAISQWLRESG